MAQVALAWVLSPVLFAWFEVDEVSGSDLDWITAATVHQPDAVGDVERLSLRWECYAVRAPGAKRMCAQPMADWWSGFRTVSMSTVPVKQSAGPRPVLLELWVILIVVQPGSVLSGRSCRCRFVTPSHPDRSGTGWPALGPASLNMASQSVIIGIQHRRS